MEVIEKEVRLPKFEVGDILAVHENGRVYYLLLVISHFNTASAYEFIDMDSLTSVSRHLSFESVKDYISTKKENCYCRIIKNDKVKLHIEEVL